VKKIFVGGISWGMDDADLEEAFLDCGEVVSAKVIREKETNKSRGFGFVEFATEEAAAKARKKDGQKLDGRTIRVSDAQEKKRDEGNGRRSDRTRD
jgi:nucleolin